MHLEPRITNPSAHLPDAWQAAMSLSAAIKDSLPSQLFGLVHLRASQINGCSFCVDIGWRHLKSVGETDERLFAVSAWRDTPFFTDAERAALALSEAITRTADKPDPMPDAIWNEAAAHFSERDLTALTLSIGMTNLWNRFNIATRHGASQWGKSKA